MPPVEAPAITMHSSHPPPSLLLHQAVFKETLRQELSPHASCLHRIICNMRTQFPDLRLIQYDCGKLQTLDILLRQLKNGAHRVLIFTQMTRMLDVLEQFLNYHGHIYLRLDGSTRVEQRQALMERFNADKRIFCFILSTRSGGVGVNLTGADTVVFYDSDWNPTMDAQAQDRCHRIGQTRDVHIYRLISERTVEENILKKANQKRMLGDMAIEGGNFTTAYFKQQTIRELFDMPLDEPTKKEGEAPVVVQEEEEDSLATKQTQILEQALCKAEDPEDIRAATKAKAEQVAELAEFNENIPLDMEDRPSKEEEEEMSKAEQEIASLVEQLTPIERYAMNFLEASLEDISREELKQAEEQVEAARKDIDQAKDEVVFKLPEDEDENYLAEEGSSKKSKKAKGASRLGSERTGTRMSERLRNTRLTPREGVSGDLESPQAKLPNLRHLRTVTNEEDDGLPQVAQHTRGAAVRRELVREEKSAQLVLNTRRIMARREEPWTKAPSAGERVQKIAPHRTEASSSGDRVLRPNPQRTELLSVGEKLLQATPQKPDPGAAGDRIIRSTPSKTEAQTSNDKSRQSTRQMSDSSLDKGLRLGPQKPEKPPGLVNLQSSSPRGEAPIPDSQDSQLYAEALDGKAFKLKADAVSQEQEEAPQLGPSASESQAAVKPPSVQVPAFQAQDGLMTAKSLGIETLSDVQKATVGTPSSKEKTPNPGPVVATQELPCETKAESVHEGNIASSEPKEALPKPEEVQRSASYCTESLSSSEKAHGQEATQESAPFGFASKIVKDRSEDVSPQATESVAATLHIKAPQTEMPSLASTERSTAAASSLLQQESLTCLKEQNGLEQPPKTGDMPCPTSDLPEEIAPLQIALPTPEATSSEANSFSESPTHSQRVVEKKPYSDNQQHNKSRSSATSPETVVLQESSSDTVTSPGAQFSDESLSPPKVPRRRTSADVQMWQSCQDQDGPAAKVLRKLPGRLVTVVEGKELIRRRRNRMRKPDTPNSITVSPSNSSAQSVSEPESSPSGKELPLLRDLPARRRIELESRAAAKEKEEGSRGEVLLSPSTEPVKRKRGRPPKNKSPEQQRQGVPQPLLEPTLEASLQSRTPEQRLPEAQPHSVTSEGKVAKTQSQSKTAEGKVFKTQSQSKTSEQKAPKASTPKKKSPKTKAKSSENKSPVEKRRRGRPPKIRESPVTSPKPPASEMLHISPTKLPITELSAGVEKSPASTSVVEMASKVHDSLDVNPKITSVSKTPPKAQKRTPTPPKSRSLSKPSPKSQEMLAIPPKLLSKSSTEACEPPATPPGALSEMEISPGSKELPSPTSVSHSSPKSSTAAESPPKRKRGRPPKNPPSPYVGAAAAPPSASASELETTQGKQSPVPSVHKRRRRRRKDDLGPSFPVGSQSSSEGEDARPLTRLALLKRDEKMEPCNEGLIQASPRDRVAEGPSSAESSTSEQRSSDTPTRSTRLRPGSLVPPLEWETQRRGKRRCSLEGSQVSHSSKSPAPQGASEQEGGESESSFRSSSESNSSKGAQRPKRRCHESEGRGRGRGRKQRRHSGMADRILRSAAKPADHTRAAPSPVPTRKTVPASTSAGGVLAASIAAPSAAPVTSSLSNRGRKPKT